ncbi:unnamed protein product [Allacma fusca]|uniref:THD domain-containing protein n=1 Tax=Allacma fusca TaxID=39272 RepID=A0A8J2P2B2_9HEXA|nr:unnamed protein product [Allacma fusca]
MSLLKKSSFVIDPEVSKFPGTRRQEGTLRAQVHAYVNFRLQTNHAVLILFLFSIVLTLVTAALSWKVRDLDLKNQVLESTLQMFICGLEKQMKLDENFAHLCSERNASGTVVVEDGEGYSMEYGERPRVKRDLGSKFDTVDNSTMPMQYSEQGGKVHRSGRGMRGKVLRVGRNLKALKMRVAVLERNLVNLKHSVFHRLDASEPRAAFLYMNADILELTKKNELIGPWSLASNGTSIGFNDQWLNTISINSDFSTVTVLENGVYFIYAQVLYHFDPTKTSLDEGNNLGFRIALRKNRSKKTIHLAECVTPPLPTKAYLTCFTQVAWYVEQWDELYLENILFTPNAFSTIYSQNSAQTFFGIVKL